MEAHKIGIRTGNFDMQIKNLKAFSPLFYVAGKLNYAHSVVYALHEIDSDPYLETILHYVASVNTTRANHFFAFDEALETYGVEFVKQSLTSHKIDPETLKLQIKAAQFEVERLSTLLTEFLNVKKPTTIHEHIITSKREIIWKLAIELLNLFEYPTNTEHRFLQTTPQMQQEGYNKIATCYENGQKRMESLYKQEITEEELRNTLGRRATEVKVYTYDEIQKIFKENKKVTKISKLQSLKSEQPNMSTSTSESIQIPIEVPKRTRIKVTEVEANRLLSLIEQSTIPTADEITAAAKDLNWSNKKVCSYIAYRRNLQKGKGKDSK